MEKIGYDEIKNMKDITNKLLKRDVSESDKNKILNRYSLLNEQVSNSSDEVTNNSDLSRTYRISGGLISIHSSESKNLKLTGDDKTAFLETMDGFVEEVSDLVDFDVLNVYDSYVEWGGKIIDMDMTFYYTVGKDSAVYLNGDMIRVDDNFVEFIDKIKTNYDKFRAVWSGVLASRKKT